jgi:hypothetical protein
MSLTNGCHSGREKVRRQRRWSQPSTTSHFLIAERGSSPALGTIVADFICRGRARLKLLLLISNFLAPFDGRSIPGYGWGPASGLATPHIYSCLTACTVISSRSVESRRGSIGTPMRFSSVGGSSYGFNVLKSQVDFMGRGHQYPVSLKLFT